MGKLEKVVVLTVLFLVALILGVSLNAPEGVAKPDPTLTATPAESETALGAEARPKRAAPITRRGAPGGDAEPWAKKGEDAGRLMLAQGDASASGLAPAPLAPSAGPIAGPGGTLSTGRPEPLVADRAAVADRTIPVPATSAASMVGATKKADGSLQTLMGLAPSLSEEFMIYTWQEGDTFAAVAERYFGSRLHVNRLLRNNEGLEDRELRAGDQILIPVHTAEEAVAAAGAGATGATGASGASTYTVQSGDVLGTISTTVYGTSKSWRKIYDANRDVLADPNRLVVGQVLRIPE